MDDVLILHEDPRSGNCYKIRLTAALLGIPLQIRSYDIMLGETRTPEFLATVNANGRIPVLQIGGRFLPESNAACYYLATGSRLVPADRFDHADMLRWMFFEQYSHEPYIAVVRHWVAHLGKTPATEPQLPMRTERGYQALAVMESHLKDNAYFAGPAYSIADIALYAYTHVAHEGGFELGHEDIHGALG